MMWLYVRFMWLLLWDTLFTVHSICLYIVDHDFEGSCTYTVCVCFCCYMPCFFAIVCYYAGDTVAFRSGTGITV